MQIAEIFRTMDYGLAPESVAQAVAWLEGRHRAFDLFIGGGWVPPLDGEYFDVRDPARGAVLARVAQGGIRDVDAAVRSAHQALPAWSAIGGHARARHLYALARHLHKHARLFAVIESIDNGKPIRESRDIDIPLAVRHFHHHAGWAQLLDREFPGYTAIGVVGQIIPWNFPLLMLAWKVAPALATGNTVVLKPAEYTPLTALLFAEICQEAGLPPGVLNIVTGDGRTGEAIVRHTGVGKIAFTGSTAVGRSIRQSTAGSGKRLMLELGGKSPFIVFEDADLDSVVEGVVDAIWFNQGEVCCAGSRILVQEGIADALARKLRARMETLRTGDPLDRSTDIGAIVDPIQLGRISDLVRRGTEEGGTVWQPSSSTPATGCFFPPTLFTDVAPADTLAQEEIFGPVVVQMTFRTPAEAVELANNTRYGLAASVWTENVNLALDIATKLLAGTVWVNSTNLFDAASEFGGYRESGFGREGGREGLRDYLMPEWERLAGPASGGDRGGPAATPPHPSPAVLVGPAHSASPTSHPEATPSAPPIPDPVLPPIDRTVKLYIGGRQVRPDSGYSFGIRDAAGRHAGEAPLGNRKDIRNAVEAARAALRGWRGATAHNRAQVLFYFAENLHALADSVAPAIDTLTGCGLDEADREVRTAVHRIFTYAAWADKWDGAVHQTPFRNLTLSIPEPLGVIGVACPVERPLLGLVSTILPPIALGNTVVAVPSERWPLLVADVYRILDASNLPPGVVNLVTGSRDELAAVLAAHDDVDAIWYFGSPAGAADVEFLSAGNLKRTWADPGLPRDWFDPEQAEGPEFLRRATQVKNIWIPFGE